MRVVELRNRGLLRSASALVIAAASLPVAAYAQPVPPASGQPAQPDGEAAEAEAEGTQENEMVVTGYRGSIIASLDDKREANGIIDVIRAEDIADFPDNNLAESIQRIPGVAITRDQGEGRQITVRGLGPLFTRVRINGMEGLSTTGGADASGGFNPRTSIGTTGSTRAIRFAIHAPARGATRRSNQAVHV